MAAFFGLTAVIFSQAKVWGSFVVVAVLLLMIEVFAEKIGLMGHNHRPLLKLYREIRYSTVKDR
jgi:UDP-GlcNAc:undecaprenyl-phosphate GlcNAc-1-phosphate transferase